MSAEAHYAWIITRDVLDGADVEIMGPRNAPAELVGRLLAGKGQAFRILDDDGELYFLGRILHTDDEVWDEDDFGPLTDFGGPDSGATEIQYREGGKWTML